jgi:short-subunit dehydrogenase
MNGLFVGIGTGPGMGISTASRFAREGFDLVLTSRDVSKLEPFAEKIRMGIGCSVELISLDATDSSAVQQFANRLGESVNVLHYNAAAMQRTDIFETPMDTVIHNIRVDIGGALAAVKYFVPGMEKRGNGTILLTGGGLALAPSPEYLTLSIGKAGIRCMTEALFSQLSARGIHIATLTVAKFVRSGSEDAVAAAEAFWALYSEPPASWTWEAILR